MTAPAQYIISDEQRYRFMASTQNMDTLRELQALVPLAHDPQALRDELNALDKALRCQGWPLAARLQRAEQLAARAEAPT